MLRSAQRMRISANACVAPSANRVVGKYVSLSVVSVAVQWMTYEYFTSHGSSSGSPSGGGADPLRDVCDGEPPVVLGTYNFTGTRTTVAPSTGEPSAWLDGIVSKHIAGVEWCVWQDGVYFMLAVNSPAGLVRRLCAFNADMRSALCTGTDGTDGGVTEHVFVTAVEPRGDRYGGGDDDASGGCVATKLGITTCKPFVNDPATPVAQAFLDGEVVSVRTSDDVPSDPTHL